MADEIHKWRMYLPLFDFKAGSLDVLFQFALSLLRGLYIFLEFCFQFSAAGLKLLQLDL